MELKKEIIVSERKLLIILFSLLNFFKIKPVFFYYRYSNCIRFCFLTADVEGIVMIQGRTISKNNFTYFQINNLRVDLDVGHINIRFNNLFNGDKELGLYFIRQEYI